MLIFSKSINNMFDSDAISYNNICRSCLISTGDMRSVFDLYSTKMSVVDVFCALTLLQRIDDNDELPTQICNDCYCELNQSYKFVLKCRESDQKLRNHLEKYIKAEAYSPTTTTKSENVFALSSANLKQSNEHTNSPSIIYEMHTVIDEKIDIVKHELDIEVKTEFNTEKMNLKNVKLENESVNQSINAQMLETVNLGSELIEHQKSPTHRNNLETSSDNNGISIDKYKNKQQGIKEKLMQDSSTRIETKRKPKHTEKKSFTCEACGKSFDRKINFIIHIRLHTDDKPYVSRKGSNVTSHSQLHNGEKPYSCPVCNKSFHFRSHQTRHMRIHSGERPYTCTVCDKSFGQSYYLIEHMRIHNEEKPFSCTVCDKSFYNVTNRTRHMRMHSGETPYSCIVCNKSYRWQSGLKIHMRLHTGDK